MKDQTIALRNAMLPMLADGAGLFSWDLIGNRIHGDTEIAHLFGVRREELAGGIPVETLIGRMHAGDRERIAKAMHTAILEGTLYQEIHRVGRGNGDYCYVLCVARCFGYEDGLPTSCAGFICETDSLEGTAKPQTPKQDNVIHFPKRT